METQPNKLDRLYIKITTKNGPAFWRVSIKNYG